MSPHLLNRVIICIAKPSSFLLLCDPMTSISKALYEAQSHTAFSLLPPSLPASLPPSLPPSFPPSLPHSLLPSFPHSLIPSFPHSLPPSLLPSLPPSRILRTSWSVHHVVRACTLKSWGNQHTSCKGSGRGANVCWSTTRHWLNLTTAAGWLP